MSSHPKKQNSGTFVLQEISQPDQVFSSDEDDTQSRDILDPSAPSTSTVIKHGTKRKSSPSEPNPSKISKLDEASILPPLGIRRVNFKTVHQKLTQCTNIPTHTREGLKSIMDAIMGRNPNEKENKSTTSPYTLKSTKQDQLRQFYSKHRELLPGKQFKLRVYGQRKNNVNNYFLTHFTGIENTAGGRTFNSVVFYYRPNDIFYVVQKHACNFVDWCADYEFPPAIASRLLSQEGYKRKKVIQILGNARSTETTNNVSEYPGTLFKSERVASYEAHVRENSSLFNLPLSIIQNLEPNKITEVRKNVKAEVGTAYFKILKNLTKYDLLAICHHLSAIITRQPMYLYKEPQTPENDSSIFESSFIQVAPALSNELTKSLVQTLFDPFKLGIPEEARNFQAGHPHFKDFSKGENFKLFFQKSIKKPKVPICVFGGMLQIPEIIKAVKDSSNFLEIIQTTPEQEDLNYLSLLQNFYIEFRVGALQKPPSNVLNFIEGFHFQSDNHLYRRMHGRWHQVSQHYLSRVHFEFLQQLNNGTLIAPRDDRCLEHKWYSVKQKDTIKKALIPTEPVSWENLYNCSYSLAEGDYIIGDTVLLEDSIKLFDIMKVVKEKDGPRAYLYHVTNGLYNIRATCVQIVQAANVVQDTAVTKVMQIEQLYWDLQEKYVQNKNILEKYEIENFVELLRNAAYVLAFVDGEEAKKNVSKFGSPANSTTRSFAREQRTKRDCSVNNLDILISGLGTANKLYSNLNITSSLNSRSKACAVTIHKLLSDNGYTDTLNHPTTKFLTATASGFKLAGCSRSQNKDIWYVLSKFRSSYPSLMPKLEIIKTGHSLKGKFRICEIFVDDEKDRCGNKAHLKFVQEKFHIELV